MALSIPVAQRDANAARAANQAAENVLCHAAHLNGYQLTDEQFAAAQRAMSDLILQQLYRLDHQFQVAALDEPATSDAEAHEIASIRNDEVEYREPRTLPAVTERW